MDFSGFLLIISIIVISGVIAYLGDVLGRRIGKQRLSLLKLRPRYTAILISIITGVIIAAITLAILAISSDGVRTALFGMKELKQKLETLNQQVADRNAELEEVRKEAENYQKRITELEQKEKDLLASRKALEDQVETLNGNIQELTIQRKNLDAEIKSLQLELDRLRTAVLAIRQGEIVFQDGEEILRGIISGRINVKEVESYLLNMIKRADDIAVKGGAGRDVTIQRAVFVIGDNFEQTVEKLASSRDDSVVRVMVSLNTLKGEPVITRFLIDVNQKIFSKGDLVFNRQVVLEPGQTNTDTLLAEILQELNTVGVKRGILPQREKVGSLPALNLTETSRKLNEMKGPVTISVYADNDIYTIGPLTVHLDVREKETPQG